MLQSVFSIGPRGEKCILCKFIFLKPICTLFEGILHPNYNIGDKLSYHSTCSKKELNLIEIVFEHEIKNKWAYMCHEPQPTIVRWPYLCPSVIM